MSRLLAPFAAVLLILIGFGYLFTQSEPVGGVEGTVTFARNGKPLGDTRITLSSDSENRRWHTRTNSQGHFVFRHIPVGKYTLRDGALHHSAGSYKTFPVVEAKITQENISLKPNGATLELAYTQQRTYGTKETPHSCAHGNRQCGR